MPLRVLAEARTQDSNSRTASEIVIRKSEREAFAVWASSGPMSAGQSSSESSKTIMNARVGSCPLAAAS